MIRAFFLLLTALSTIALAERPDGFLGIKWGASPEEAKRIMQARPGVTIGADADDYRFELTGGTFAGQAVEKWILEFPERKFAMAAVVLKTKKLQTKDTADSLYRDFRTQLASKYGSSTSSKRLTLERNGNGGGGGQRAKSYGNISTWRFIPSFKDKTVIVITAELTGPGGGAAASEDQLGLTIRYENETLTSAAEKNVAAGEAAAKVKVTKEEL